VTEGNILVLLFWFASAWPIVREVLPFGTSTVNSTEAVITIIIIITIMYSIENDPILIPVSTK